MKLDVLTLNNRYVKLAVQEVIDMKRTKLDDRLLPDYTRGEEIFNMVTHIVGAAFGVAALVLCIIFSCLHHNGYGLASGIVYGVSMILLYTMSSIYHGLSPNLNG